MNKIKTLRIKNNLTQKEIAEVLGTSGSNYSRYESGEWNFTIKHLKALAKFYDVSVSYLVDDENDDILISKEDLEILIKAKNVISKLEKAYLKRNKNE